ncbi:VOC family protein [Pseudonocardia humida]|uniref:VOC family protein n=1 Tax=Pseudonocardia humida TaxID=2800819 RepID=A0ABT0ZWC3_9PSEU|nr:VOC family protein [Pseudonocardia humida]MCO1655026.1 VOC family protein [Pseudonocardia humida]
MPTTIQPIILTTDAERLAAFYAGLLGATETRRVPADGPVFFIGLTVDDAEVGVVADASVDTTVTPRVLISIDVPDVDALLDRVGELGGKVLGPPNDMAWGQRVAHVQDPDGNPVNLTQPI